MTANRLLAYGTGRELGRFNRDRVWQRNRDTSRFATDASCCKPGERERLDLRIVARRYCTARRHSRVVRPLRYILPISRQFPIPVTTIVQ